MSILAQVTAHDRRIFHLLLIPGGLWLIVVGLRAMRRREFHLRNRSAAVQGRGAFGLGLIAFFMGCFCCVAGVLGL